MYNYNNSCINMVPPANEPIYTYEVASTERRLLKKTISDIKKEQIEIPIIINGKEIKTGKTSEITLPHNKKTVIGKYHQASEKELNEAINASLEASKEWSKFRWEERAAIFMKAAELLSTKYRHIVNAATMLSISKNVYQSEIDAVCELVDFFRFNVYFMQKIYNEQPVFSTKGTYNFSEYRPMEGFIFAATPFNFVSISGNLPTAPVIMGNVSVWKPASTSVLAPYYIMKILKEAGLPDGVINFVPCPGSKVGKVCLNNPSLAGIHFTGSTEVFKSMWQQVGNNIFDYKTYPRLVGETGGKDFVFVHNSADIQQLVTALVRGAFEYQGQKCSAVSRAYIPKSIWKKVKDSLLSETSKIKIGDIENFSNFMNAVIDKTSFDNIKSYIDYARGSSEANIISGGNCDDSVGYFIDPTIIETNNPTFKTMVEEIFGPVLTIFVYDDSKYEETLALCDKTSVYGLTGAIFANDRKAISIAAKKLRYAAGNFYINDKPTGAVVGQQPFGGARDSGTNDKAGSLLNLIRWVSTRSIKESYNAPSDFSYPFMLEK